MAITVESEIKAERKKAIDDMATAFERSLSVAEAVIVENQTRVQAAEQKVARLSQLPYRLSSSRKEKVAAMKELMLAQIHQRSSIAMLSSLKTNSTSIPSKVESELSSMDLVYDGFKINALFTDKELKSTDVIELKKIVKAAEKTYEATNPSHKQKNNLLDTLEKELEKSQKNVNSFRRHFRTRSQQKKAIQNLNNARARLENLKHPATDQEIKLKEAITNATNEAETLRKEVYKQTEMLQPTESHKLALYAAEDKVDTLKAELETFQKSQAAKPLPEKSQPPEPPVQKQTGRLEAGTKAKILEKFESRHPLSSKQQEFQLEQAVLTAQKNYNKADHFLGNKGKKAELKTELETAKLALNEFRKEVAHKELEADTSKKAQPITHALNDTPPPPPLRPVAPPPPISNDTPLPNPDRVKPKR